MHACTHTRACKRTDTRARTEEEMALEGYPQRRPAGVKGTIIILAGRCKLEMEKDIKESQLNPRGSTVRTTCCSAVQHVATAQQVLCRCCNTARHVATRHGMLRHGTACCNTARHVATRHGMLQHGTTCCNTAKSCSLVDVRGSDQIDHPSTRFCIERQAPDRRKQHSAQRLQWVLL